MAISKPILLALVGAVLALGAFYATMGARSSDEGPQTPTKPAAKPHPAKARATEKTKADAKAQSDSASKSTPAPGQRSAKAPPATRDIAGAPAGVVRALASDRPVVLFFYGRGSDDAATAKAVSAVRRRGGARVFSAPLSRLADYGAVTAGAGVSQAPSVVILRKGRGARLVEGFVDAETLTQHVADTR